MDRNPTFSPENCLVNFVLVNFEPIRPGERRLRRTLKQEIVRPDFSRAPCFGDTPDEPGECINSINAVIVHVNAVDDIKELGILMR